MAIVKAIEGKKQVVAVKSKSIARNTITRPIEKKVSKSIDYSNVQAWDTTTLSLAVRNGVGFNVFKKLAEITPFSEPDWSRILNLSQRTLQRYEVQKKTFDPIYSDRILQIAILFNKGIDVFGNKENFNIWLETKHTALGGIKPKSLLDTTFGISLVADELSKIENGVLA